jgi:hypothetical protein
MAIGKAASLGAVAAVGVPYLLVDIEDQVGELIETGLSRIAAGDVHIPFSWPIFGFVTLFAFGFLAWAQK